MDNYLTRWLLTGPAAQLPPGCLGVHDLPACTLAELTVFRSTPGAIGEAWRDDEVELRAAAVRLGIKPCWPGERFFAEACSVQDATR